LENDMGDDFLVGRSLTVKSITGAVFSIAIFGAIAAAVLIVAGHTPAPPSKAADRLPTRPAPAPAEQPISPPAVVASPAPPAPVAVPRPHVAPRKKHATARRRVRLRRPHAKSPHPATPVTQSHCFLLGCFATSSK
jgi:hypothetical protein